MAKLHEPLQQTSLGETDSRSPYKPLQKDEFRVVKISKAPSGATFDCTTMTVSWDNPPTYTALSYVWGSEENPGIVNIDTNSINVTRNLFDALGELWGLDPHRVWWIDALCIDQKNHSERAHQVERMPWIYANAEKVLIYLRSEASLATISLYFNLDDKESRRTWLREMVLLTNIRSVWDQFCSEFHTLCQNPYWSRVWIVQEVAYAQSASVFITGGFTIAYERLMHEDILWDLRITFLEMETALLFSKESPILQALWNGPARIGQAGSARNGQESGYRSNNWLITIQGKQCKDPRDYIYAMFHLFPPELRDRIAINYEIPYLELFSFFTRTCIQATNDLSIIVWGKAGEIDSGVPSWTGNICKGVADPFTGYDLHSRPFSSNETTIRFSDDSKRLHVCGKVIGEIVAICSLTLEPEQLFYSLGLTLSPFTLRVLIDTVGLGQKRSYADWPERKCMAGPA
ncbi:HET-domain-containing protein [Lophiostoma macrostomum CBS 122681]|uniref:HET-domain-containing protein n=1 Tax=Lophiostoma macrostomum CBS 122681 TaxID=1314788 RepID=A0A6A6TDH9_9PLEO|nr:HET-domain-containing protein [Lophiostoma macrostomum CBS 122681]